MRKTYFNAEQLNSKIDKPDGGNFLGKIFFDVPDGTQWKPQEGTNHIRILPSVTEGEMMGKDIWVHYSVGINKSSVLCPYRMEGKKCPVCEEGKMLKDSGAPENDYKQLWNTKRAVFFILDKSKNATETGIQLYIAPKTVGEKIFNLCRIKETGECIDISSPTEGYDIFFDLKKGKEFWDVDYNGFERSQKTNSISEEIINDIPEFGDVLVHHNYMEIKREMFGEDLEEEEPKREETKREEPKREEPKKEEPKEDKPSEVNDSTSDDSSIDENSEAGMSFKERLAKKKQGQ